MLHWKSLNDIAMKKKKIYQRPNIRTVEVSETVGMLTAQTAESHIDDSPWEASHKTSWWDVGHLQK